MHQTEYGWYTSEHVWIQSQDFVLSSNCDIYENACSQTSSYRICGPRSKHNHVLCGGRKTTHPSHPWCTGQGHPLNSLCSRHTFPLISISWKGVEAVGSTEGFVGLFLLMVKRKSDVATAEYSWWVVVPTRTSPSVLLLTIRRFLALPALVTGILSCSSVNRKCRQCCQIFLITPFAPEPRNELPQILVVISHSNGVCTKFPRDKTKALFVAWIASSIARSCHPFDNMWLRCGGTSDKVSVFVEANVHFCQQLEG